VVQLPQYHGIPSCKRRNTKSLAGVLGGHASVVPPEVGPVHKLYSMTADDGRDRLLQAPRDRSIEARLYFPGAHDQLIFAGRAIRFPVAEQIAKRNLCIPFHAKLGVDKLQLIATAIERDKAQA
jgi:dTDP-4-amino-4,6-dideoxygalactose transaminase